jgi:dipeptidase E
MPRLLLASWGIGALADFVGRPPAEVRVAFVPTAAAPYPGASFLAADRDRLRELGYPVTDLDLVGIGREELSVALEATDLLYVAGGNTFFLLHHMRRSGLDALLPEAFAAGLLYAGVSAGATVVGPDCEPASAFDDLADAPELASMEGLGLVDFVVLPHYGDEEEMPRFQSTIDRYQDRHELVLLRDDEAVRVEGDGAYAIVPSP